VSDIMKKNETSVIGKIWVVASQLDQLTAISDVFKHSLKSEADPKSVIAKEGLRFGLKEDTVDNILEKRDSNSFSQEEINELARFYSYLIELKRKAEEEYVCAEV
jgi:hypothetical protein